MALKKNLFLCYKPNEPYFCTNFILFKGKKKTTPSEAVAWVCSIKKVFLSKSLFNRVAGQTPTTLLKKRLQRRCFPVNFEKRLRTLFIEHLRTTAAAPLLPQLHSLQRLLFKIG